MTMEQRVLKTLVLTMADDLFLPRNVSRLAREPCVMLQLIVVVNSAGSLRRKWRHFLRWFGPWEFVKLACALGVGMVRRLADFLTGYRLAGGIGSLKAVAQQSGVQLQIVRNANAPDFLESVRRLCPDLIVSYSCPQVLRQEILSLPKQGVINVHGSYLPYFRGVLPSFWTLHRNETQAGATVHFMNEAIDDGDIITQGRVDIADCNTMYQVMAKTKELGGQLVLKAVRQIAQGTVERKPNLKVEGHYFSWPTKDEVKAFLRSGKRLI